MATSERTADGPVTVSLSVPFAAGQSRPRMTSRPFPHMVKPARDPVRVCRRLPRSAPKRVVSEPDTGKPDADNVAKLVMDALNGHAYEDDAQVTSLRVTKMPRSRVTCDLMEVEVFRG